MYQYSYHRCQIRCWIRLAVAIAVSLLFLTAVGLIVEVAVTPWPQQLFPVPSSPSQSSGCQGLAARGAAGAGQGCGERGT